MAEKKETFKPSMLTEATVLANANEKHLDLRLGEPTFFYLILSNPNED